MVSIEMSSHAGEGPVVVVLRGELDVTDAAKVAASLTVATAGGRCVIVDLEDLQFIDCSGLTVLARGRRHARSAGSDLLLAAPQRQVLRMLAITGLLDVFAVLACVDKAVGRRIPRAIAPAPAGNPAILAMAAQTPCVLLAAGAG